MSRFLCLMSTEAAGIAASSAHVTNFGRLRKKLRLVLDDVAGGAAGDMPQVGRKIAGLEEQDHSHGWLNMLWPQVCYGTCPLSARVLQLMLSGSDPATVAEASKVRSGKWVLASSLGIVAQRYPGVSFWAMGRCPTLRSGRCAEL